MRLMAEKLPELVLASSCSKNFGLYRERTLLADSIQDNAAGLDFSHIKRQNGMFSFLGIAPEHLTRLREEFGIYIVSSTRINLAGINSSNIDYLAESIRTVLK